MWQLHAHAMASTICINNCCSFASQNTRYVHMYIILYVYKMYVNRTFFLTEVPPLNERHYFVTRRNRNLHDNSWLNLICERASCFPSARFDANTNPLVKPNRDAFFGRCSALLQHVPIGCADAASYLCKSSRSQQWNRARARWKVKVAPLETHTNRLLLHVYARTHFSWSTLYMISFYIDPSKCFSLRLLFTDNDYRFLIFSEIIKFTFQWSDT